MADVFRIKVQGAAELRAALAELGPEVATKVGRTANRKAARALADEVRRNTPVNPEGETPKYRVSKGGVSTKAFYGQLKDNIRVRLRRARREFTITYQVTTGRAFWARFLEFGTVNMSARPFMRPAFDAMREKLLGAQIEELGRGIERAAKRARRRMLPNGRNA
ncbi:MAG: HK97 gp10 family phage protein [Alphaproteobacteria bacterium]|nr:HK97 gp10 family phage protein [Alphaproteobacteria bacterium]